MFRHKIRVPVKTDYSETKAGKFFSKEQFGLRTHYNGVWYRSRMEVRVAIFLERLGLEFVYEPQQYDLGLWGKYTPDFYIPKLVFCRVQELQQNSGCPNIE
jgi:hypothetical protein